MHARLDEILRHLRRTPTTLRALVGALESAWVEKGYGEDTFSPLDVLGHLIHGEKADWVGRARIIREHGPSRPFDPYDRFAFRAEIPGRTGEDLLDEFERRRLENVATVEGWNLTEDDLALEGTHPDFGTVTLRQLLATWVVHDLAHTSQIAKGLAYRYRDAVGPWRAYLSILP